MPKVLPLDHEAEEKKRTRPKRLCHVQQRSLLVFSFSPFFFLFSSCCHASELCFVIKFETASAHACMRTCVIARERKRSQKAHGPWMEQTDPTITGGGLCYIGHCNFVPVRRIVYFPDLLGTKWLGAKDNCAIDGDADCVVTYDAIGTVQYDVWRSMNASLSYPGGTGTGTSIGSMNTREAVFPTRCVPKHKLYFFFGKKTEREKNSLATQRAIAANSRPVLFLFCTLVETNRCREGRRCRPATRLSDCAACTPYRVPCAM
jgi:hypothetical protein